MHLIHKLSVKSICKCKCGVNCNTIQTFPHASITEFTKFPIISLPYNHYIEKRNVPKLKKSLAEHLFNHCKSKFLAEVNVISVFSVYLK